MNIGPSEAETFWTPFLPKLVRRGLRGIKLVVRDAHAGVKATVRKGRQHRLAGLPRPLHAQHTLAHAGESRPRVVAAFIATAFAQDDAETTTAQWCKVAEACRNLGIRHVRARALPAQNQRKGRAHGPDPWPVLSKRFIQRMPCRLHGPPKPASARLIIPRSDHGNRASSQMSGALT